MMGDNAPVVISRINRLRRSVPALAFGAGSIAIVTLCAWAFADASRQIKWRPLFVMKANTAVGIFFAATALLGAAKRWKPIWIWSCAAVPMTLFLLTLSEYLFQCNLGIDQVIVVDTTPVRFPGRTSPVTAIGLIFISTALALFGARRYSASQVIFFLAAAAPISALGGYLYNAPGLSSHTSSPIVSLHTAVCQLLLCVGGLFLRPDEGPMRVVVSQSRAGSIARVLMPLAVVMPLAAGMLIVAGEQSRLMSVPFGSALLVSCCVLFFSSAVWITTSLLWKTERIQAAAEQALGRTRARLDAALIASEIGIWEWNIAENRVFADRNLAAMFSVSEADATGGTIESYLKAVHPDDLLLVRRTISGAVEGGAAYSCEYRLRCDGTDRWVLARGKVDRDRDPTRPSVFLSSVVLDVTEQRRAELELRRSEHRRKLALETAELGTWSIDPAGMNLITDARFREIFGTLAESVTYEQAMTLIHPDDRELVRTAIASAWRSASSASSTVEYRVIHPDGSFRWIFATGRSNAPLEGIETARASFDGTIADVTERKQAEQERERLLESERLARIEAERAGRMKDEFLATLSHEIRTPLNAILGWSQIMRGSKDPADLATGLEVIERNARSQSQIVEDLLDMSRIISGKVRLDVQRVDLAAVVQAAVDTARPTADAKGVKLRSVIDPLIGITVSGDFNRLQQVLWNLISNAVKFTPKDGRVQVLLERVNSHLEMSVIDTGEGISPEFLPYVFDRFRQADASTTRRHGGLGLGLSIVKQLVELHGGSVRVNSAGEGMGSTFVVVLPLIAIQQEAVEEERRHPRGETALSAVPRVLDDIAGVRVLVVDDEPDARALVQRLLEDRKAVVSAAASSDEAMKLLRGSSFDVLVSDIGMPGQDGYALINRVRALGKGEGGGIPAIALTAYARAEDRVRAVSAGFLMHVSKPVEPMELVTMVAAAAGRTGRQSL